jgi:hypothetical protein
MRFWLGAVLALMHEPLKTLGEAEIALHLYLPLQKCGDDVFVPMYETIKLFLAAFDDAVGVGGIL